MPTPAAATDQVLLSLRSVSKTYRMGDLSVPVLHDVNLEVCQGELVVVVGPSGSGKSTLMNLIGGIDAPTSGEILFDGRSVSQFGDRELTLYRRQSVGFVFQFYNLVPTLTAMENVIVATEIADNPLDPQEALRLVELEHRLNHFPAQLSGGEQQRVAIARAVAKRPRLLLCDEPTGALDLETGRHILQVLTDLNVTMAMTMIIITHNSAIAGISHQILRIGSGTITEDRRNERRIPAQEVTW